MLSVTEDAKVWGGAIRGGWFSFFWNTVGFLAMFAMFSVSLSYFFVGESDIVGDILYGITGPFSIAGMVRVLMMGVRARPDVLVIRELFKTFRIPWSDIDRFECEGGHWREVTAPTVYLKEPMKIGSDDDVRSMGIMSLGSYEIIPFGKSLPRRATDGLNEHLRRYRAARPEVREPAVDPDPEPAD